LGDEHAIQHFQATASHLHSLVFWHSANVGDLLYVWGQRDKAKVYKLEGKTLGETPQITRENPNEGHPGAMLSLSANGAEDGILWAAIHATGDSWHESRPGVLHAYDADDIRHELWNSLQVPSRDDCGEYSKMAPPTIANGRVYLPSFGSENVGTGQFCVYGLLPTNRRPTLEAPTDAKTSILEGNLTLTWSRVVGAQIYRVLRTSTLEPKEKTVAWGLTTPKFTEPAPERGETATYRIVAISPDGSGAMSEIVTVTSPKPKPMEP
jgi:hypothetical protein